MPAKRGGSSKLNSTHKGESTATHNEVGGHYSTHSVKGRRAGGNKKVPASVSYDTLYEYANFQIVDGTSIGLLNDDEPVEKYIQEAAAYLRENKDIKAFSIRYSVNVASNKRRLFYHTGTDLVSKDPSTSPKYTVYSYQNIEYKASTMPTANPIYPGVPYPFSPFLTEIRLNNLNVDENKENELVGTVSSVLSKSSSSASVSYTVDDNNQNKFEIVGSQLKTKGFLDFETKSTYDILITATVDNSIHNVMTVPFTISVINDAGEGPTSISLTGTTIDENLSGLYTIGQLSADNVTSAQFSMPPESTEFQINGIYLQKKDGVILDYETQSSYSIEITATDMFSNSYSQTFTITVNDTNDAPNNVMLSHNNIEEGTVPGATIGTLSTVDQDTTQTYTYSLSDNTYFAISGDSLIISDQPNASTLLASSSPYSVQVTSTDSGTPHKSYTKTFQIIVTPPRPYFMLTFDTGDTNVPLGDVYLPKLGTEYSPNNYITYTMEWDFGGEKVTGNQDDYVATVGNALGKSHVRNYSSASSGTIKIYEVQSPYNQKFRFGHYSRGWDNNFLSSSAPNYLTMVQTNDENEEGNPGYWGLTNNLSRLDNAFFNCKKLKQVPSYLPPSVKGLYQTFAFAMYEAMSTDTSGVDRIECNQFLQWQTENVEEFKSCFQSPITSNAALTNEDFTGWNISSCNGDGLSNMFRRQSNFIGTGLNSWELPPAVNNLGQMFRECNSFNGNIEDWDVSNITSFADMFRDCEAFNRYIRRWEVQPGCTLTGMFSGANGMNSRFGSGGAEYTEYYGNTPDIQFFNYTPTTIEMFDGAVHVLAVTDGVFDPENSSAQLQGHDKESILKLTLGSEVTAFSTKFKNTTNNIFSFGFNTIDMSNSKITTLQDDCFEGLYVQHAILNKELIEIGNGCFKNCSALCVLTIPEDSDLNYIGVRAFENATNFRGLYLPTKVCDESQNNISFNSSAFSDSSLEYVYFGSKGDNTANSDGVQTLKGKDNVDVTVDVTDYNTTKITTSNGTVTSCNIVGVAGEHLIISVFVGGAFKNVLVGSLKTRVVELDLGSITNINNNTFTYMSSLKVIDLRRANKLKTISNNSFANPAGSTTLETVHFHAETFPLLTSHGSDTFQGNDNLQFDTLDLSVYPNLTQILGHVFTKSEITTLKLGEGITSIDDWNPFCEDTIETLDLSKATSLTTLSTVSKNDNPFGNQSNINKVILNGGVTTVNNYFGNSDNMLIEIPENNALGITESTTALGNYNVTVTFV